MSEWIEWNGGECPVAVGADVSVKFRNGEVHRDTDPDGWLWGRWGGSVSEIIAYQLHDAGVDQNTLAGDSTQATTFGPMEPRPTPVMDALAGVVTEPGLAINPKDAIGSTKLPLHLWPSEATAMGCLGMLEGREKYGRNNFIAGDGVVASIYVDAAKRHLDAWFSGEENAHDTGTPHLANALATIAIIVKCMAHGKLIDDREYSPQPSGTAYRRFIEGLTPHVKRIQQMFKDKNPRHFTISDVEQSA